MSISNLILIYQRSYKYKYKDYLITKFIIEIFLQLYNEDEIDLVYESIQPRVTTDQTDITPS